MNLFEYMPDSLEIWIVCVGFLVTAWKALVPVSARVEQVTSHFSNPTVGTRWARRVLHSGYWLGAVLVLVLAVGVSAYTLLEAIVDGRPASDPQIRSLVQGPVYELDGEARDPDLILVRVVPDAALPDSGGARYTMKGAASASAERVVYGLSVARHLLPTVSSYYWMTVCVFAAVYVLGVALLLLVAKFVRELFDGDGAVVAPAPGMTRGGAAGAAAAPVPRGERAHRRYPGVAGLTLSIADRHGAESREVIDVSIGGVRLRRGRPLGAGQTVKLGAGPACGQLEAVVLEDSELGTRFRFATQTLSAECLLSLLGAEPQRLQADP